MAKKWGIFQSQLPTTLTSLIILGSCFPGIAKAQLIPDSSLGKESSLVKQDPANIIRQLIEGGAKRNSNLFHSFQDFNVNSGKEVYFNPNDAAIKNILTRVTGGNISNIDGVLGVIGNSNLFLINPQGIIFGAGAKLDLNGSFVGSTADSILFDNFNFSATNPQTVPLLTINVPIGLGFRDNPGDIEVNSTELNIDPEKIAVDQAIGLIGGNIKLNRANLGFFTTDITIGSLIAPGQVKFDEKFNFTLPNNLTLGNISLRETKLRGDNLTIHGGAVFLQNPLLFNSVTGGNLTAGDIKIIGQDIKIASTEGGGPFKRLLISSSTRGKNTRAGDILIDGENISIDNDFYEPIAILSEARGKNSHSGSITITGKNIFLKSGSYLDARSALVRTFAYGDNTRAGDINIGNIQAEEIKIWGKHSIESRISSGINSQTGNVNIGNNSTNKVEISDGPDISLRAASRRRKSPDGHKNKTGDINIFGKDISISAPVRFSSLFNLAGDYSEAGDINIGNKFTDSVYAIDSRGDVRIISSVGNFSQGGDINILGKYIALYEVGNSVSGSNSQGGDINIGNEATISAFIFNVFSGSFNYQEEITDSNIEITNSNIQGGNIVVFADEIRLYELSTGLVSNNSKAGDITILGDSIVLNNYFRSYYLTSEVKGNNSQSGNITIGSKSTNSINLNYYAFLFTGKTDQLPGSAGNIKILANEDININSSRIITQIFTGSPTPESGEITIESFAGSITIKDSLLATRNLIDMTIGTFIPAGSIEIIAPKTVEIIDTPIFTENLQILDNFLVEDNNEPDGSNIFTNLTQENKANLIDTFPVNSQNIDPTIEPSKDFITLPDNIITPEQLLSVSICQKQDYVYANFREQQTDLIKLDSETENSEIEQETRLKSEKNTSIQQAKGWIINEKGEVLLVDYNPSEKTIKHQINIPECLPQ